jgi:hypothetical protein
MNKRLSCLHRGQPSSLRRSLGRTPAVFPLLPGFAHRHGSRDRAFLGQLERPGGQHHDRDTTSKFYSAETKVASSPLERDGVCRRR